MKKYILSDFYFFNSDYILKVSADLFALILFIILSVNIIFFEDLMLNGFFPGILLLIVLPDALRSMKEGIFFLKLIFDIFIFFLLLIDPFCSKNLFEFKRELFYIITIFILIDIIILILHSFCYKYPCMANLAENLKNKFEWLD
jgi:hypothetical protein